MEFSWFVFTLSLTVIGLDLPVIGSVDVLSDYILSAATGGHCGETISSEESVYVKSHVGAGMFGGLTSYNKNTDCKVTFVADAGKKVLVLFPFFDLQRPDGDTCNDWLQFSVGSAEDTTTSTVPETTEQTTTTDATSLQPSSASSAGTSTLSTTDDPSTTTQAPSTTSTTESTSQTTNTGSTTETTITTTQASEETPDRICVKPDYFTSSTNQLSIRFVSDGSTQKRGFNLLVTSFHDGTCTSSEFQCDVNRCISSSLVCDGIEHCIDGADESKDKAKCSMLDNAIGSVTSLGSLAVLAIVIVVVVIIFTILVVIIFWKYIKGDATCKPADDEEESDIPIVKITKDKENEEGSKQVKRKKSVTIGYRETRVSPTPVDTVRKETGGKAKGRSHETNSDVEW